MSEGRAANTSRTAEFGLTINGQEQIRVKATQLIDESETNGIELFMNQDAFNQLRLVEPDDETTKYVILNACLQCSQVIVKMISELMEKK